MVGELNERLGKEEEAFQSFARAAAGESPLPASFVRMALMQLESDSEEAIRTLVEADRRLPGTPSILSVLAMLYAGEGRYEEAIATFEQVKCLVEADANQELTPGFYLRYGSVCDEAGHASKMEAVLEECVERFENAHEALNYLAYTWAEQGVKLDRALDYVQRALAHEPENGAYLDTLGWVYYRQARYDDALEYLVRAGEAMPDDPVITEHLGDVYLVRGDAERAVEYWTKALGLDPQNENLARRLREHGVDPAVLLEENGRTRHAGD
jgi:tetratricopeptide (TPR) repeat protein